jgi:hypothetical protein
MAFPIPDSSVVISLARRPERRAAFTASWTSSGWEQVLPTPVVVDAVDGADGELPEFLAGQPGVYGCWASHVAVLRQALEDDVACLAVFEDDAVFQPDSASWLAALLADLPEAVTAVWLDATILGGDNRQLHGGFGSCRLLRPPFRTHAYLMTNGLIRRIVPLVSARPGHIDVLFRELLPPALRCTVAAAVPSLVEQSDAASDTMSDWRQGFSGEVQRSNRSRWLRRLPSIT